MAKIKSVSNYNGTSWDTPIPLGADDANIDITNATTDPTTDTTATAAGLIEADVVAGAGDTDATAWTKFNKFRRRVYNAFSGVAGVSIANSLVSSSATSKVYSAAYINNYMTNVIGHSGVVTPTDGTIIDQLNTTNQNLNNYVAKTGDTMTGTLTRTVNNSAAGVLTQHITADKDSLPASGSAWNITPMRITDKDGDNLYLEQYTIQSAGRRLMTYHSYNKDLTSNHLYMGWDANNNAEISLSHPAAWRSALGLDIVPFKVATTVLDGSYFRYPVGSATDSKITTRHCAIISPYYSTGFMSNYCFTSQVSNGYANIYVRTGSGAQVSAGTTINVAGIFIRI